MCYILHWKLLAHSGIDKLPWLFFCVCEDLGIKFSSPFCAVVGVYCKYVTNEEGCSPTFVLIFKNSGVGKTA